jgi:hypothetical protein
MITIHAHDLRVGDTIVEQRETRPADRWPVEATRFHTSHITDIPVVVATLVMASGHRSEIEFPLDTSLTVER